MGKKRSEQQKKLQDLRIPNGATEERKGHKSTKQEDTCAIWVGGREDEFYSGLKKHPGLKTLVMAHSKIIKKHRHQGKAKVTLVVKQKKAHKEKEKQTSLQ